MGQKYRKLVRFAFLGCLLCGFAGFGGGYIYAKRTTYELPKNFFRLYARGLMAEEKEQKMIRKKVKVKSKLNR